MGSTLMWAVSQLGHFLPFSAQPEILGKGRSCGVAISFLSFITNLGAPPPLSEEPCAIVGTEGKTKKEGMIQCLRGYHQAVEGALFWLVVEVAL